MGGERGTNRNSGHRIVCSAAGTKLMPAPEATRGNTECQSVGRKSLGWTPAVLHEEASRSSSIAVSHRSVRIQVSCTSRDRETVRVLARGWSRGNITTHSSWYRGSQRKEGLEEEEWEVMKAASKVPSAMLPG
jgi:hypothetical protein